MVKHKEEALKMFELIKEIQDIQWKSTGPVLKLQVIRNEVSDNPQLHMKWVPKSKSFKKKVREKVKDKVMTNKMEKSTKDTNQVWTLRFNGSKCKQGARAGIELINPKGKSYYATYHLQFFCTNNVVEYEALVRGFLMALEKHVKILMVKGDSQLVIRQIKGTYSRNNWRLQTYKKWVCNLMEEF